MTFNGSHDYSLLRHLCLDLSPKKQTHRKSIKTASQHLQNIIFIMLKRSTKSKYDPARFQIQLEAGVSSLLDVKTGKTLVAGQFIVMPFSCRSPSIQDYRVKQIDTSRAGHPVVVVEGYNTTSNTVLKIRPHDEVLCFTPDTYGTNFIMDFAVYTPQPHVEQVAVEHDEMPRKSKRIRA